MCLFPGYSIRLDFHYVLNKVVENNLFLVLFLFLMIITIIASKSNIRHYDNIIDLMVHAYNLKAKIKIKNTYN